MKSQFQMSRGFRIVISVIVALIIGLTGFVIKDRRNKPVTLDEVEKVMGEQEQVVETEKAEPMMAVPAASRVFRDHGGHAVFATPTISNRGPVPPVNPYLGK